MSKKIYAFTKRDLRVASHILIMQDFERRISAVPIDFPKASKLIDNLRKAIAREDADYKTDLGSLITPDITAADVKRDRAWGAIISMANIYNRENSPGTDEQKAVAQAVEAVRKKYNVSSSASLADESATLNQAIADFERRGIDFSVFAMQHLFDELKASNKVVFDAICSRQDDRAIQVTGLTKTNRANTDAAYDALVEMVEAMCVLYPTDELDKFVTEWNSMVNYIRVQMLKGKSVSGNNGEQVDIDMSDAPDSPSPDAPVAGDQTTTDPDDNGTINGGNAEW